MNQSVTLPNNESQLQSQLQSQPQSQSQVNNNDGAVDMELSDDSVSAIGVSIAISLVGAAEVQSEAKQAAPQPESLVQAYATRFGIVDTSGISGLSYAEMMKHPSNGDSYQVCDVYDARVPVVQKIFADMEVIFQKLLHPKITHQMLLIVLRQSIATQTNYALRTTPSCLACDPMKHYNEALLTCMGQKLNLPSVTQLQRAQISMRISKSGLGLRCLAEAQIPISYVCSFIQAIPLCYDSLLSSGGAAEGERLACVEEFMRNVRWIRRNAFRTIANEKDRQKAIDNLLPATFAECLVKFRYAVAKHLQHALSMAFEDALFTAMMHDTGTSLADRARLLDLTARFASAWMQTSPSHEHLTLTDDQVDVAVRGRNGNDAVECDHKTLRCPRCGFLYAIDSWHPLWCQKNKKCGMNDRHDKATNRIVEVAKSNGISARPEPNVYGDGDTNPGARPDLVVNLLKKSCVGDLTYRYICSPSYLNSGNALVPGRVLSYAENSKTSKHKYRAAKAGYDFYPMAMSTNGAMGPQLIRLFMEMSEEDSKRISRNPLPISKSSYDQQANLQMVLSAQQYPLSPMAMDPAPDPPPGPNILNGVPHSGIASDARLAELVAGAKASEAIDLMSPEPSMFWDLVRVLAISTQRENANLVLNDFGAARIFVRDLNHNKVVAHI